MIFETIVDLSIRAVGGFLEVALMSYEPKSRAEKVQKQLKPFKDKKVLIRTGEVLRGGKFRYDETFEGSNFQVSLDGEDLIINTNEKIITIPGKTISRFYTGKKSNARVCINTNGVDYLIEDIALEGTL